MINIYELSNIKKSDLERLMKRAQDDIDKVKSNVEKIIATVRADGDAALIRFTKEWDDPAYDKTKLVVSESDIEEAYKNTASEIINSIREQIILSKQFHQLQKQQIRMWEKEMEAGIVVGEKWTPIAGC